MSAWLFSAVCTQRELFSLPGPYTPHTCLWKCSSDRVDQINVWILTYVTSTLITASRNNWAHIYAHVTVTAPSWARGCPWSVHVKLFPPESQSTRWSSHCSYQQSSLWCHKHWSSFNLLSLIWAHGKTWPYTWLFRDDISPLDGHMLVTSCLWLLLFLDFFVFVFVFVQTNWATITRIHLKPWLNFT